MKISRSRLKELVKETMIRENEYQEFFKKCLEKTGKSIPEMSEDEKKAFFNKIDKSWNGKGEKKESVSKLDESTRRSNDFFNDSKHGKAIYKILGGKEFKAGKVKQYLDSILDKAGDVKGIRIWDFIGNELGMDTRKYGNQPVRKYEFALMDAIDDLYNVHNKKESVTEGELPPALKKAIEDKKKKDGKTESLTGNQSKLDVDGDGDIEADDLADLRNGKKTNESKSKLNEEKISVGSKVVINYPTFVKPQNGVVSQILKSNNGLVYVMKGSGGVWDEKHVTLI